MRLNTNGILVLFDRVDRPDRRFLNLPNRQNSVKVLVSKSQSEKSVLTSKTDPDGQSNRHTSPVGNGAPK